MKKLLLSMALVLSAGNLFGLSIADYSQQIGGGQQPQQLFFLDEDCTPAGYSTSYQGGIGSTTRRPISAGNPTYDAYADCMKKRGLQPAKSLF